MFISPLVLCMTTTTCSKRKSVIANNDANDTAYDDAVTEPPIVAVADPSPAAQRLTACLIHVRASTAVTTLSPSLDPGGPNTLRRLRGGGRPGTGHGCCGCVYRAAVGSILWYSLSVSPPPPTYHNSAVL